MALELYVQGGGGKGGISVLQTSLVHMWVGYEERKTPIDFEVNRSKVKVV